MTKTKLVTLAMVVSLATLTTACGNSNGVEATANTQTEVAVQESEQDPCEANGHTFKDATCAEPKICTVCGATEGAPDTSMHDWGIRTVEKAKTCSICGATEGEPIKVKKTDIVLHEGDSGVHMLGNGYVSYWWDDNDTTYLDIIDLDGNVVDTRTYTYDGVSGGYGVWYSTVNGELYLSFTGMTGETDLGASNNKLSIMGPEKNIIWSSDKWEGYYAPQCFESDGKILAYLYHEDPEKNVIIDLETDEKVEAVATNPDLYTMLEHDESKYATYEKREASPYIFANPAGTTTWGFVDEQGNEVAMYCDAADFSDSGYSLVSDNRRVYYLVDSDFNEVSDKMFEGKGAYLSRDIKNSFIVTREDGSQYVINVE